MAVSDTILARITCRAADQVGQNVLYYFQTDAVAPEPTLQMVADALYTVFAPVYAAALSTGTTFEHVEVQRVFPGPPTLTFRSTAAATPGANGTQLLPRQVSGIITKRTANAGRRFRGRAYIPFPSEESSSATGEPTAGYLGVLGAVAISIAASRVVPNGAGSATFIPVIHHRDTPSTPSFITQAIERDRWATQRRRGSFGRPNPPA